MKKNLRMKRTIIGVSVMLMAAALSGCNPKNTTDTTDTTAATAVTDTADTKAATETAAAVTFTDDLDREVTVEHPAKTGVVMGSFAQIWQLAGGELSAVTKDAYDQNGINLSDTVVNLGDMMTPDLELLLSSDLDFVLLSSKIEGHVAMKDTLEQAGIACAYFEVETFDDYLDMLKICTEITGNSDKYKENGEAVKETIDTIRANVPEAETGKTVLLLRAYSTGVKAKGSDNMTGVMLKDLGCVNIADSEGSLLEELSMEQIISADPDYIFVTTMGESEEKALASVKELLTDQPSWKNLTAVKEDHYYVLPKDLFHLKPNNRWGESYQMLADILYGKEDK